MGTGGFLEGQRASPCTARGSSWILNYTGQGREEALAGLASFVPVALFLPLTRPDRQRRKDRPCNDRHNDYSRRSIRKNNDVPRETSLFFWFDAFSSSSSSTSVLTACLALACLGAKVTRVYLLDSPRVVERTGGGLLDFESGSKDIEMILLGSPGTYGVIDGILGVSPLVALECWNFLRCG